MYQSFNQLLSCPPNAAFILDFSFDFTLMFQSGVQPTRTGLPQVLHEELHGGESPLPGLRTLSCESSGERCHGLSDPAGVRD